MFLISVEFLASNKRSHLWLKNSSHHALLPQMPSAGHGWLLQPMSMGSLNPEAQELLIGLLKTLFLTSLNIKQNCFCCCFTASQNFPVQHQNTVHPET